MWRARSHRPLPLWRVSLESAERTTAVLVDVRVLMLCSRLCFADNEDKRDLRAEALLPRVGAGAGTGGGVVLV
jgi:hypothetical protein